jgi:hypothetical protein
MNKIAQNGTITRDRLWRVLLICMTLAALMPEYIAPILVFVVSIMYFCKLKAEGRRPIFSTVGWPLSGLCNMAVLGINMDLQQNNRSSRCNSVGIVILFLSFYIGNCQQL